MRLSVSKISFVRVYKKIVLVAISLHLLLLYAGIKYVFNGGNKYEKSHSCSFELTQYKK